MKVQSRLNHFSPSLLITRRNFYQVAKAYIRLLAVISIKSEMRQNDVHHGHAFVGACCCPTALYKGRTLSSPPP